MDQNRDWRPILALVLGGLAIFLAFRGGRGGDDNIQAATVPQVIIVQPAAPSGSSAGVAPAPVVVAPGPQSGIAPSHSGWKGGSPFFALFPLLFLAGLAFVAFRVIGNTRRGWGGYPSGGRGPGHHGPPPSQQGAYPPQQGDQGQQQSYQQPHSAYPQGQQPQGPPQAGQPGQGQPTRWTGDPNGDITRPEGSRDQ